MEWGWRVASRTITYKQNIFSFKNLAVYRAIGDGQAFNMLQLKLLGYNSLFFRHSKEFLGVPMVAQCNESD